MNCGKKQRVQEQKEKKKKKVDGDTWTYQGLTNKTPTFATQHITTLSSLKG